MLNGRGTRLRQSPLASIAVAFLIQSMALQFVLHVVPSFLRKAGYPPEVVGLAFLAFLPYALRFVWAPLVDRYGWTRMGRRRTWIVLAQIGTAFCGGLLLLVEPTGGALPVIALSALLVVAVATQGIATGGYMVTALQASARVAGTSIQAASVGLAGLVLGGLLYATGDLGWRSVVELFILLSVFGFGVLLLVRGLLGMLLFIETALLLAQGMKPIVQVDAGMSMASIGVVGVFGGNLAGLVGAALAAPVVARVGARRVLIGLLAASCALNGWLALVLGDPTPGIAVAFVLSASLISFAYFAASRSVVLGICDPRRAATELSTFLCISNVSMLLLASAGTAIAGRFGPQAPFALSAAIALAAAVWMLLGGAKGLNALWEGGSAHASTAGDKAVAPEG